MLRVSRHILSARVGLGVLALVFCAAAHAELRQVTIGTNPAGTHSYAVAAGIAKLIQDEHGTQSRIRPYSGSSVYIPLLHRGEITLGMNTSIDSYLAYSGYEPYGAAMPNLRLLARTFPLYMMYMVRGDSDLYRIEDLRDRRVVVGIRANAALGVLSRAILATGGLSGDDIDEISVGGLPDAARLLTEGRVDAASIGVGTALTLQAHATIAGGIRYLTMGQNEAKLSELMPGSKVSPAPLGPSVGLDEVPRVSEISNFVNTGTHVAEDDAYQLAKTIHEHWQELRESYISMSGVPPEGMVPVDVPLPYHDGAVKYYREAGLWTEAHEQNQLRVGARP